MKTNPKNVDAVLSEMRRGAAMVWYGGRAFLLSLDGSCRLVPLGTARAATRREGVMRDRRFANVYVTRIG